MKSFIQETFHSLIHETFHSLIHSFLYLVKKYLFNICMLDTILFLRKQMGMPALGGKEVYVATWSRKD